MKIWKFQELIIISIINGIILFLIMENKDTRDTLAKLIVYIFLINNIILMYFYWKITAIQHVIWNVVVKSIDGNVEEINKRLKKLEEKK
jgi:hypothetical protein